MHLSGNLKYPNQGPSFPEHLDKKGDEKAMNIETKSQWTTPEGKGVCGGWGGGGCPTTNYHKSTI